MTLIVDEVMLREPNLLIPGKKPVGPVKIDWNHELAPKDLCVLFRNKPEELVQGVVLNDGTLTNLLTSEVNSGEQTYRFNAPSSLAWFNLPKNIDYYNAGDLWSITWRGTTVSGNDGIFIGTPSNGIDYIWMGANLLRINSGINYQITITSSWASMQWHTVVFTSDGYRLYSDGSFIQAYTGNNAPADLEIKCIGSSYTTAAYSFDGSLSAVYIHDFGLTDNQVTNLHHDPYQFLIPA